MFLVFYNLPKNTPFIHPRTQIRENHKSFTCLINIYDHVVTASSTLASNSKGQKLLLNIFLLSSCFSPSHLLGVDVNIVYISFPLEAMISEINFKRHPKYCPPHLQIDRNKTRLDSS